MKTILVGLSVVIALISCNEKKEYIIYDKFVDNSNQWNIDSEHFIDLDDTTTSHNSVIYGGELIINTNISNLAGSIYTDIEIDTLKDIEIGFKIKNETSNNYYLAGMLLFENIYYSKNISNTGNDKNIKYNNYINQSNFIGVSKDGGIALRGFTNNNWNTIFYSSDSIVKKNEFNEIRILSYKDSTTIFVNSKKITTTERIVKYGKRFTLSACPSGKVHFDDFYMKYIENRK